MFTFAVTAYNEMTEPQLHGQRLLDCIAAAQSHEAIGEIVIVDDGSEDFPDLISVLSGKGNPGLKVKLFRNQTNLGVFTNKVEAIARATGEWVITCDSDNVMDKAYIDRAVEVAKDKAAWYCPGYARPVFDYRGLIGSYVIESVRNMLRLPVSHCAINTGNQIVHRESFMDVFGKFRGVRRFDLLLPNYLKASRKHRQSEASWLAYGASDSCLFNLLWMQAGHQIQITRGLEYDHHVHKDKTGSNYDRAPREKVDLSIRLVEILQGINP